MYELKDYLNAINFSKQNLMDEDDKTFHREIGEKPQHECYKKYPAFVINRCMSMFYNCIAQANEMNGYHFLDNDVQFNFYINSIRKQKRYGGKWLKQNVSKDIEYVKEYYDYSTAKAEEALSLLTKEQIELIKLSMNRGGRKRR